MIVTGTLSNHTFKVLLSKTLGKGSYGCVYECVNMQTKAKYAIKLFKSTLRDIVRSQLILKEVQVLKLVSGQKGLPNLIDYGQLRYESNLHYFVILEHLGEDLSLTDIDASTCIRVGLQVLNSIESLHELGYIHGDVKPNNILLKNGKASLIDFGLSTKYVDEFGNHVPNKK